MDRSTQRGGGRRQRSVRRCRKPFDTFGTPDKLGGVGIGACPGFDTKDHQFIEMKTVNLPGSLSFLCFCSQV